MRGHGHPHPWPRLLTPVPRLTAFSWSKHLPSRDVQLSSQFPRRAVPLCVRDGPAQALTPSLLSSSKKELDSLPLDLVLLAAASRGPSPGQVARNTL